MNKAAEETKTVEIGSIEELWDIHDALTSPTLGGRLKAARVKKGLMQKDVAAVLDCAPTSLTNWENDKVQPSLEVLARLCEVLEINPIDLLGRRYTFEELVKISSKPVYERSYAETIALNFSGGTLEKLMPAELQRKQAQENLELAAFLRDTGLLERFGGDAPQTVITSVKADYERFGDADADILFAYHLLTLDAKNAFLGMIMGLISDGGNCQNFINKEDNNGGADMDMAAEHTIKQLARRLRANRHPVNVAGK